MVVLRLWTNQIHIPDDIIFMFVTSGPFITYKYTIFVLLVVEGRTPHIVVNFCSIWSLDKWCKSVSFANRTTSSYFHI